MRAEAIARDFAKSTRSWADKLKDDIDSAEADKIPEIRARRTRRCPALCLPSDIRLQYVHIEA